MFPGWNGGGEWGGVGFDPKTHVAYINATDFGLTESLFKNTAGGGGRSTYMRQCSACHGQDRAGAPPLIPPLVDIGKRLDAAQIAGVLQSGRGRMPPFPNLDVAASKALIQYLLNNGAEAEGAAAAPDAPAQYDTTGYHAFLDPQGYPATSTPWGTLNAINLDTGEYLWKIPFGQYPDLVAQGMPDTGSENFGGPVITAGGVLFIGATTIDKKFRAFDMKTGKLLWETLLPFSATATPATYAIKGRQYVVIAAGGQRDPATPPGGVYVAYALPQ
jgi:quinoprotein glucose dehydrogenase